MISCFLRRLALLTCTGLLLAGAPAHAQYLDLNFHPPATFEVYHDYEEQAASLARDASGRLLVGGTLDVRGTAVVGHLIRLLSTGAVDPTFNPSGTGANGKVCRVVVLPSGNLLIGGTFTRYNGTAVGHVARLLPDGALDPTFNAGSSGADDAVTALAADPAGGAYLTGRFVSFNGQPAMGLVHLTATGAVDATFQVGTGVHSINPFNSFVTRAEPSRLLLDGTGRLLVMGISSYRGTLTGAVARILPTGALDTSFNPGGVGLYGQVYDAALLPTGGLLIAGGLSSYNGATVRGLLRLLPTGSLDPSFAPPATLGNHLVAVTPLPSGAIVVATLDKVRRLLANGAFDATFTPAAVTGFYTQSLRSLLVLPNGGLVVGGAFDEVNGTPAGGLAQLLPSGATDLGFTAPTIGMRLLGNQFLPLPQDSLLALASFDLVTSGAPGYLTRLGPGGQPDPGFLVNALTTPVSVAGVSPAGRIFAGTTYGHVVRLTRTGAADPAFADGTGATGGFVWLKVICPLADGRVLVGGQFNTYNGVACDGLVRLLPTGAVDATFQPSAAPGQQVLAITVRADGHLLLTTQSNQSATTQGLVALLPDGGADVTFGGGNPSPDYFKGTVVALPDTSVLVAGSFNGALAIPRVPIQRLTRLGTRDARFLADPSIPLDGEVTALAVQLDGGIVFSTRFDPRVRRLKPDGALDPTFQPVEVGTGYYSESVSQLLVQSNQRVVLGGQFADVAGTPFPGLARLAGLPLGVSEPTQITATTPRTSIFPNPAHETLTIQRPAAASASARLYDALGRLSRTWPLTQPRQSVALSGLPTGVYVLRIQMTGGAATAHRVVIE